MMYRIACEHRDSAPDRYQGGDKPLVYLVTTIRAVVDAGLTWIATDGNAATATSEFSADLPAALNMIDWPLMRAERWKSTPDDLDRQRRRQAEFLVHRLLPLELVRWVGVHATPRPSLNHLRALLLVTISRYLARARLQEVREGVSELEVQKLAYFLQVVGAPLQLSFVRGTYGPYAPQLAHALDALEGHHLTGLGDRSARVTEFAPINPVDESVDAAELLMAGQAADLQRLATLFDLVEGFETPYSLELLATVHFASGHEPKTGDPIALSDRVASWSLRKSRMFTAKHVAVAAAQLAEHGLLPA